MGERELDEVPHVQCNMLFEMVLMHSCMLGEVGQRRRSAARQCLLAKEVCCCDEFERDWIVIGTEFRYGRGSATTNQRSLNDKAGVECGGGVMSVPRRSGRGLECGSPIFGCGD
ncbi:hypothetical protein TNCV_4909961 [Trichonephila clavipes]|nr:hypothetical protein TNCV_4909961 [Trichonephila clavipes]